MSSEFYKAGGAALTSKNDSWETPQRLFDALNEHFRFDVDAAASHTNHKLPRYWTVADDALAQNWGGLRVWVNPPYGRAMKKWLAKAHSESMKPGTLVVALVPARTDTAWFHDHVAGAHAQAMFYRGRLRFETGGVPGDAAPFGSMLVLWPGDTGQTLDAIADGLPVLR